MTIASTTVAPLTEASASRLGKRFDVHAFEDPLSQLRASTPPFGDDIGRDGDWLALRERPFDDFLHASLATFQRKERTGIEGDSGQAALFRLNLFDW
jgi:hypothetical protein